MASEKEIENEIDNILQASESQKASINMQEIIRDNMFAFLQTKLKKAIAGDTIKNTVEKEVLSRLQDKNDPIKMGSLLKLYEIITTKQVQEEGKIFDLLAGNNKNNNNPLGEIVAKPVTEYTLEDIQQAKKALTQVNVLVESDKLKDLLGVISDIDNGEFVREDKKKE